MRYLFLLYSDESEETRISEAEMKEIIAEHTAFAQRMRDAGKYVAGAGLEPSTTATLVRRGPGGEDLITDGPYVESKEQIGGLYLLECADLDDAVATAKRIPHGTNLAIEVRPAPH